MGSHADRGSRGTGRAPANEVNIDEKKIKQPGASRKTISFRELKRLSFCNSEKLPRTIELNGRRHQWVGIGWVDEGEPDGTETLVVD